MMRRSILLLVLSACALFWTLVSPRVASANSLELKMATLAPKGSAWAKAMEKNAKDVEEKTAGRVKFKYFFGGQQGDERDVVRKIKLSQLDGAAVTAVGLSLIKGDVRVLELPFMFRTDRELDLVRDKLAKDFEKQFEDAGYVLLAWGDVGWVHLFTNVSVGGRADLAKTKMWAWTDDIIVRSFFKRLGINGVPLGVPDVLPSLQTGLINACYGSPLAAVALQWYTKIKYGTSLPVSYSIGAMVLKKETWNKLSPEDQKILRETASVLGSDLMKLVRKDNERARKAMEKSGVQFVQVPAAMLADIEKEGRAVWDELVGKLYSKELLEKVKKTLAEARK
ncbi:MAG: TRAP transporter substrate-binding protein DctP [Deltaproteobacteria bacterium]|nr:TRAP transporter substrate-binding protein DctP [Deltaproteobacteria bacterium]